MNSEAVVQHLVGWLKTEVEKAGALGITVGVSGGVDSAVAAVIAQKAFPDDIMALFLPCESDIVDRVHARILFERFNIRHRVIDLDNAYRLLATQFESYLKLEGPEGRLLRANIKARLRMIALYFSAQARHYLVLGTSNRSEMSVGYATKHGDAGVDLQILGDLLKKEVFELANYLEIPEQIINKVPSGGLWMGQTDEAEMGISYQELDKYLESKEGSPELTEKIERMIKASEHKRRMPAIAIVPDELK